jgi:hypothetical protein
MVCEVVGLAPVRMPRIDVGDRPSYREVFDAEARRLFELRYADDIERLGYEL